MSTHFLHRIAAAVRERYERTALARFGAGLHTDCDDCAVEPADVAIPSPRASRSTSPRIAAHRS